MSWESALEMVCIHLMISCGLEGALQTRGLGELGWKRSPNPFRQYFSPDPGILARMCFCKLSIFIDYILCEWWIHAMQLESTKSTRSRILARSRKFTPESRRFSPELTCQKLLKNCCRFATLQVICNICPNNDFCPQAVFKNKPWFRLIFLNRQKLEPEWGSRYISIPILWVQQGLGRARSFLWIVITGPMHASRG